ncbi:hypothetical protein [Melghirimyces thermohalophilus]|uniref:hypothetical protein n=1 Tax=Melghirimyces thermohalophilus TaxID=1236220 RepID=UPI00115FDCED|nr:hypothetical protein [Melghirimyces thermohalophilus]
MHKIVSAAEAVSPINDGDTLRCRRLWSGRLPLSFVGSASESCCLRVDGDRQQPRGSREKK